MNFEEYRKIVKQKMGAKRFLHSENVAKQALKLARIYGCDPAKAEIAGILHDVTKEFSPDEQLQIIKNGGIILTEVERCSSKLWHSISGSVYIRDELGVTDEDIINAVRYHTSGRANMSLLEKIIYTADFTSDERSYKGVDVIRERSYKSLDSAMLYGLSFTISDLSKKEQIIHPDALALYNEILIKKLPSERK